MATRSARTLRLLAAARSNPQLAQRVAGQLPEQLRLAFIDELAKPAAAPPPSARPGVKKCPTPRPAPTALAQQLTLFARSVARVS